MIKEAQREKDKPVEMKNLLQKRLERGMQAKIKEMIDKANLANLKQMV